MCSLTPYVKAISKNQYFEINYSSHEKFMFIGNDIPEQFWTDFHYFHSMYLHSSLPIEINNILSIQNNIVFKANIGLHRGVPFVNMIIWLVFYNNIMKESKLIYFNTKYGLHIIEVNYKGINYTFIQEKFLKK